LQASVELHPVLHLLLSLLLLTMNAVDLPAQDSSSRKNRITGKVPVLPLKNSLSEMNEITVASRFSSMVIFFRDSLGPRHS
jgi:hypothetical protein